MRIVFLPIIILISAGMTLPAANTNNAVSTTVTETQTEIEEMEYGEDGGLEELEHILSEEIALEDGVWSVYVENLDTGEKLQINNQKMISASLIKLFIMGEVYNEIDSGITEKSNVDDYLENMITVSDNYSSNVLVALLGGGEYSDMHGSYFQSGLEKVNRFASEIGCNDTEQQRDMLDYRDVPVREENYTSPVDCGRFLSKLYRKQLISYESDTEMMETLKRQTRRSKIPEGLPQGVECANKTGELGTVENDAAIVFSPACDYIICVMSNKLTDTERARSRIASMSYVVYEYFNQEDNYTYRE